MKNSDQENIALPNSQPRSIADLEKHYRSEIRFWQSIALNLAIFAFGLITSLVISLVVLLMSL